jgi:hypothetical protein
MRFAREGSPSSQNLKLGLADLYLTNVQASEILSRLFTKDNHLFRCSCLCSLYHDNVVPQGTFLFSLFIHTTPGSVWLFALIKRNQASNFGGFVGDKAREQKFSEIKNLVKNPLTNNQSYVIILLR